MSLTVTMDATGEKTAENQVCIDITSNLPEDTWLILSLSSGKDIRRSGRRILIGRSFNADFRLFFGDDPVPIRDYDLEVTLDHQQQDPEVIAAIGNAGENLSGPLVLSDEMAGGRNVVALFSVHIGEGKEFSIQPENYYHHTIICRNEIYRS